ALTVSLERLEAMVADAGTVSELLEVERLVTERQSELESLQAYQRSLADQVALSTFTLTLQEEPVSPTPEARNFWDGLSSGWDSLLAALSGLLVGLGVALPWLVLVGAVLLVVLAVRR